MENVCAAVKYFSRLSGSGYKFNATEFDNKLKELSEIESGLKDAEITILLRVLTNARLAVRRFQNLLYCVLPETTVQKDHIRTVVVWILNNFLTESPKKIVSVLQWLIVLLENDLADREAINTCYHQFFYLIFIESVARWACKIVFLLTTPDDITSNRALRLISSRNKQQRPHHIEALLGLFKSFRPELVPQRVSTVNKLTAFGRIPVKLSEAVNKLTSTHRANVAGPTQDINPQADAELVTRVDGSFSSDSDYPVQKVKRRKKNDDLIPAPVYISVGSRHYSNSGGLTMDNFQSLEALAGFQLSVETPSVSLAMLHSDRGRHMLTFCQNTRLISFNFQLHNLLDEVFLKGQRTSHLQEKRRLLEIMAEHQDYAHQPLPAVSLFVKEYLCLWEGGLFTKYVLKLMTWLQFSSHRELQQHYLSPLYTLFVSSSVKVKCVIIRTLAQLFSNLMLSEHYKDHRGLFLCGTPQWNAEETYLCILKFASYMFGQGFSQAETTVILVPEVLRFYEKVLTVIEETNTQLCVLPAIGLLSAALSSYDATALSRVCQLLTRCNRTIKQRSHPTMKEYFNEVSLALIRYNAEMLHILKGEIPASDGIFSKWVKGKKLEKRSAKTITVNVISHPAITSVMWPILNQQLTAESHDSREKVDEWTALKNHLPHLYDYLKKS